MMIQIYFFEIAHYAKTINQKKAKTEKKSETKKMNQKDQMFKGLARKCSKYTVFYLAFSRINVFILSITFVR